MCRHFYQFVWHTREPPQHMWRYMKKYFSLLQQHLLKIIILNIFTCVVEWENTGCMSNISSRNSEAQWILIMTSWMSNYYQTSLSSQPSSNSTTTFTTSASNKRIYFHIFKRQGRVSHKLKFGEKVPLLGQEKANYMFVKYGTNKLRFKFYIFLC